MKKILLLSIVVIGSLQITYAQYPRMVLFEEFTQASCGPCASQNPAFNTLLQDNEDKALSIKYQVWWPGFDPMYLQNEADVDSRVSYYGVAGVPHATMDGMNVTNDCGYYTGAPACVDQAEIDAASAITSPFQIMATHSFNADYTMINVHVDVTSDIDMTGTLRLHVVIAENEIIFETAPGSNGELEFFGVMKKMLPSAAGTTTGDFAAAETKSYDFSWELANIYNLNEIQVVAFMQENTTKAVLQAGLSAPMGGLPEIDYAINSISSITCSASYEPVINVMNNSDEALTMLDLVYSVDGGADNTYNWTGSIPMNSSGDITLPSITLVGGGNHDLDVEIVSVGEIDINLVNDKMSADISVLDVSVNEVEEGFVEAAFPPENWALDNLSNGTGWSRATGGIGAYGESTTSAKADFYNIAVGIFDLYLPKLDLSTYTGDLQLEFDRAYAKYNNTYIDELRILISDDCGETWDELYSKLSDDLATANNTTSLFVPDDDEWETDNISMDAYAGSSDLIVKFQAVTGYGNMLYVDNIRLSTSTGIIQLQSLANFSVYPNPADDYITASFNLIESADIIVQVVDVTGKSVAIINGGNLLSGINSITINTTDFASGIYSVVINANGKNVAFENIVVTE